jgi:hypothetical protein
MSVRDKIAAFFSPEGGQARRRWLDDKDARFTEGMRHYLGPSGLDQKAAAIAKALEYTDAGDMTEAAEASRSLWEDPSLQNAARYATAGAAMAIPFVGAKMMGDGVDVAGDALRSLKDDAGRFVGDEAGALGRGGKADEVARMLREGRASDVTDDMMAEADPQELWRLYESGATGADMPMDAASRMQRAEGMGFDTGTPLYHGTGADVVAFKPSRMNSWMHPPGAYLAGDGPTGSGALEASGYAEKAGDLADGGANVMPLTDRAGKGLSYGINDGGYNRMQDLHSEIVDAGGLEWSDGAKIWDGVKEKTGAASYFDAATPGDFQHGDYAKRVVLDPSHIRSRFARFDPRLSHLRNLSAGVGGAALIDEDTRDSLRGVLRPEERKMQEIRNYLEALR